LILGKLSIRTPPRRWNIWLWRNNWEHKCRSNLSRLCTWYISTCSK